MKRKNVVYDIRSIENAKKTLENITHIPSAIWERYIGKKEEYGYTWEEDFVKHIIELHGNIQSSYKDWIFIYSHITTSVVYH